MNGRGLMVSTTERMTAATRGVKAIETATMTDSSDEPRAATRASASRNPGNASRMSMRTTVHALDPAAREPRQRADQCASRQRQRDHGERHLERDLRAEQDAREHIAAELIGAEPMHSRHRRQRVRHVGLKRRVGRDPRRAQGHDHQEGKDDRPDREAGMT